MRYVKMTVHGLVQGVGFRYMAKYRAYALHISGTVKNLADGSVQIFAYGKKEDIDRYIDVIKSSPSPAATVDEVIIDELDPSEVKNQQSFQVIY